MVTEMIFLLPVFIASILYLTIIVIHGYWKRKNVPGPAPTLFGGNIGAVLKGKKSIGDVYADIYKEYQRYPFVGIYKIFTPAIVLIDLDVVKTVMIKDFANFGENTLGFSTESVLVKKNPFVLNLQEWKPVRQQLASLLSNSKLKPVAAIFNDSAEKMVNYIKKEIGSDENSALTVEAKVFSSTYTTKNVASWGFGIEAENFTDDPFDIFEMAKHIFQFNFLQNLSFLVMMIFPPLGPFLNTRLISASAEKRIAAVIQHTIQHRINSNNDRNDFLGALLSLKSTGTLTDDEVVSHIGALFVDGIETSGMVLHYALYELAANPEIQENLRKEIDETLKTNESDIISIETIQAMKYLDAVLNEALRIHLVLPFLDKRTTKQCTLSGRSIDGEELEVTLDAGTSVVVPLLGLHMDERYFPEPSTFNPDRFFGDNKEKIPKFSFMPFGEGPRACLGRLFGTYQSKTAVVYIIRNFKISLGDGTPYPIDIDPTQFLSTPKQPIRIKFQLRK